MPSVSLKTVYPWQQSAWQRLQLSRQTNQLAHAYLLEGKAGMGKQDFLSLFAYSLFCTSPTDEGYACGHCAGCHLFLADSHPDWHLVTPEAPSKTIKIEQVRELVDYSSQTAQLNGYKVIFLVPAEAMNQASANALLKTLEEPGAQTILLLVTENAASLPVTVRSRCQLLRFDCPTQAQSLEWLTNATKADVNHALLLKLAQGAPLQALKLYQNNEYTDRLNWFEVWRNWVAKKAGLMESTQRLQKADLARLLFHLCTWVADILRIQSGASAEQVTNIDFYSELVNLSQSSDSAKIFAYLNYLQEIRSKVMHHANLNTTLLLEDVLLKM